MTVDVIPGPSGDRLALERVPSSRSYGQRDQVRDRVVEGDEDDPGTSNSFRIRSPTSSMIASNSSCRASASPISLMTASSAARSSVSARSRFVSSNSRAFSSATRHARRDRARAAARRPRRRRPARTPRARSPRSRGRRSDRAPRARTRRRDRRRRGRCAPRCRSASTLVPTAKRAPLDVAMTSGWCRPVIRVGRSDAIGCRLRRRHRSRTEEIDRCPSSWRRDEHRSRVEDRPDPLADELDDGTRSRAASRAPSPISLMTASSAARCVGLGEQPLRLPEQAGVLERDAHARRDRARAGARRRRRRRSSRGSRARAGRGRARRRGSGHAEPGLAVRPGLGPAEGIAVCPASRCGAACDRGSRATSGRCRTGSARVWIPLPVVDLVRERRSGRSASSYSRDEHVVRRRRSSRTRSPTSSMIASKSSCRASASPISLITASSALRWRVSSIARARASAEATCWPTKASRSRSACGVRVPAE